jgi:hypothetical protein
MKEVQSLEWSQVSGTRVDCVHGVGIVSQRKLCALLDLFVENDMHGQLSQNFFKSLFSGCLLSLWSERSEIDGNNTDMKSRRESAIRSGEKATCVTPDS